MKIQPLTVILVVVVGSAAFLGGMKYQESKTSKTFQGQFDNSPFSGRNRNQNGSTGTNTQTGVGQRRMGNGQVIGEITSVDTKSITVKTTDGSSKIILLTDKTAINKATEGQISDLKTGEKVAVFGTPNTDGSVNGQNIQLNPSTPAAMPSGTPPQSN